MGFVRNIVIGLGFLGYAGAACAANSCSNIDAFGSYDRSGLQENDGYISAVGSFRIAGEADEDKQPNFNLSQVDCEPQFNDEGKATGLECKLVKALVWAHVGKPDTENPNCSLDLDASSFPMKELQKGILAGVEGGATGCFNTMLTIDRNAKRVYLSFTRTQYADKYDKIKLGTCGVPPRTEVLMNCTGWARSRKGGAPRYCDFSGAGDK